MSRYRKLYVIGNGFDRHYGLPTDYEDFGEYVRCQDEDLYNEMTELFPGKLWQEFEHSLGSLTLDDVMSDIFGLLSFDPDSDFAMEQESAALNYHMTALETVLNLANITGLFCNWIEGIIIPGSLPDDGLVQDNEHTAYLSFNYTQTLEKAFDVDARRVCHIHGVQGDSNLVIGHEPINPQHDEQPQQYYEQDAIEELRIRFIEASEKPVERIIRRNEDFFASLSNVVEITVIGFSFSDVDQPYIGELKRSVAPNCKWHVYLHETRAKKLRDAIAHVVDCIGCDFEISLF